MKNIKQEFLSTEMAPWRKKGIIVMFIALSLFPFYMVYISHKPDGEFGLWELRHFIGMAALQAAAQISMGWYILKNRVPQYVIMSAVCMALSFQATFGISVVLLASA